MLTRLLIRIGAFLVLVLAALGFEYFKRKKKNKPSGNIIEVPFDVNDGGASDKAEDNSNDSSNTDAESEAETDETK